jgi:hypothetical protein
MLETTVGQLIAMDQALDRIGHERLPIKIAYAVTKVQRQIKTETAQAKTTQNGWIRELGVERTVTPDEQAKGVAKTLEVTPEHMPEFLRRLNELYAVPVSLDVTPLPLAQVDGLVISPADLTVLTPLIAES